MSGNNLDADAVYERKYQILSKKCVEVKQETDRIYERLLRCKRLLGTVLYERRALKEKLERHYRDRLSASEVPVFREEDFAYEVLLSQKQELVPNNIGKQADNTFSMPNSVVYPPQDQSSVPVLTKNPPVVKVEESGRKPRARGSRKQNKKDPNAPRKPVNAYFLFCQKNRNHVQVQLSQEKGGEVDRKEVTKILGKMWADLGKEGQSIFYNEYYKNKERYGLELQGYKQSGVDSIKTDSNLDSTDAPDPSRSMSSTPGPSETKRARKSKTPVSKISSGIPSAASSPLCKASIAGTSSLTDYEANIKLEASISGTSMLLDAPMDTLSSQSSLTPTLGDQQMLNQSPITYHHHVSNPIGQMSFFGDPSGGDEATDDVFLAASHQHRHSIESPDFSALMMRSSPVDTGFRVQQQQQQSFQHSLQASQQFQAHSQSNNEMPVP